ncbi:MAG: aldo/keto reductase [Eubacteriales bacterium]
MRYTNIKGYQESIKVAKTVLGVSMMGSAIPKELSFEMLDYYVSVGGNTFDTARVYADWLPGGASASEKTLGSWMKARGNREDIIVVTKGGHPGIETMSISRMNEDAINADLEMSLSCLGTSYIDIYFLHRDDESVPVEQIIDIMDKLAKSGKIKAFGASNWKANRIKAANEYAKKTNKIQITVSQIQWSYALVTPELLGDSSLVCMNDEEYAMYQELKIPVMAFSSQAKGFMVKAIANGVENLSPKLQSFICEENLYRLEKLKKKSEETGILPETLSLSYITDNELDGIVVTGMSSMEQLKNNLS